jgi:hypothetical protein
MTRILKIFLLFSSILISEVYAQDLKSWDAKNNIYSIESISSKASAKSSNASKIIATANARRDAFMVLLMRLQIPIATADEITNEEIAEMVRSEQIVDEKIIGNNYSGIFNITFAQDFVDYILKSKIKNEDQNKSVELENYIVLPIKMLKNKPTIWEQENDWLTMFKRVVEKNNLSKNFIVPEPNIENVAQFNSQNIKNLSFENFRNIVESNNAHSVYLLNYNLDEIANKVLVEVTCFRKLQKKQFRLSFVNVDRLSYNNLVIKVAERTLDYLKNNPVGNDNALNKNPVDLFIKIASISDWLNIKGVFDKANFIDGYEIKSVSKDEAKICINYLNIKNPIENEFTKLGLIFSKRDNNIFDINAIGR